VIDVPPKGPRPLRSQAARDRILDAAREVFASQGYERSTIRAIAASASVNPAMVIRYYGSKEGVFAAAARFELRLPDFGNVPPSEIAERLVRHFVARWEGSGTLGELQALLRAGVTHAAARNKLLEIFQVQLSAAVATVTAPADAGRRAGLIASQMLGLALTRYILEVPEIAAMNAAELATAIAPTIHRYLFDDAAVSKIAP
jgi:AcrR family transcriptional regulator